MTHYLLEIPYNGEWSPEIARQTADNVGRVLGNFVAETLDGQVQENGLVRVVNATRISHPNGISREPEIGTEDFKFKIQYGSGQSTINLADLSMANGIRTIKAEFNMFGHGPLRQEGTEISAMFDMLKQLGAISLDIKREFYSL